MDMLKFAKVIQAIQSGVDSYNRETLTSIPLHVNHKSFMYELEQCANKLPDGDEKDYYLSLIRLEEEITRVGRLRGKALG